MSKSGIRAGGIAAAGTVVVAVVAAGLAGCSSGGEGNAGPLGGGPVNGSVCFAGKRVVAVALDDLRNTSGSPIRVEEFTLVGSRGLRLLGVDLVPVVSAVGGELLGAGGPWPPSPRYLAGSPDAHWGERRALPMTMPPDKPGHSWNLAFGVERTAAAGTANYRLRYEWRGNQYIWSAQTALRVATVPTQCPTPGHPHSPRTAAPRTARE